MRGQALHSYLSHKINPCLWEWRRIIFHSYWVVDGHVLPQDSILGPILFIIYVLSRLSFSCFAIHQCYCCGGAILKAVYYGHCYYLPPNYEVIFWGHLNPLPKSFVFSLEVLRRITKLQMNTRIVLRRGTCSIESKSSLLYMTFIIQI